MSGDVEDYTPINVWHAGGVEYTDYRLPSGVIVSIETGEQS